MKTLTTRLRTFANEGFPIATEAADELERLTRELANARAIDVHSCGPGCTRPGCVNAGLRAELAAIKQWQQQGEFLIP